MNQKIFVGLMLATLLLSACFSSYRDPGETFAVSSLIDGVFLLREGNESTLPAPRHAVLVAGDGVNVDEVGKALLRFPNQLLTVTIMRQGSLTIQQASIQEQGTEITVLQNSGTFINDYNPQTEIKQRITVKTDYAVITEPQADFMVVSGEGEGADWIVNLEESQSESPIAFYSQNKPRQPQSLPAGQVQFLASNGFVSALIRPDPLALQNWIQQIQAGQPVVAFGDAILPPARISATLDLQDLDLLNRDLLINGVQFRLLTEEGKPQPVYQVMDCNGDGALDLAVEQGTVELDLGGLLARARSLDVDLVGLSSGATGMVEIFSAGRSLLAAQSLSAAADRFQTTRIEAELPFYLARLSLTDGCLTSFALGPGTFSPKLLVVGEPTGTATPTPAPPRPVQVAATATPTPTLARSAPELIGPADGAIFSRRDTVTLSWRDPSPLAPGESFQVTILFSPESGVTWQDVQLTRENSLGVPAYLNGLMGWERRARWSVAVVSTAGAVDGETSQSGPTSAQRTFLWDNWVPPTATPTLTPEPTATATSRPTPILQRPPSPTPTPLTGPNGQTRP